MVLCCGNLAVASPMKPLAPEPVAPASPPEDSPTPKAAQQKALEKAASHASAWGLARNMARFSA